VKVVEERQKEKDPTERLLSFLGIFSSVGPYRSSLVTIGKVPSFWRPRELSVPLSMVLPSFFFSRETDASNASFSSCNALSPPLLAASSTAYGDGGSPVSL